MLLTKLFFLQACKEKKIFTVIDKLPQNKAVGSGLLATVAKLLLEQIYSLQ